jgi:predicted secreted protein
MAIFMQNNAGFQLQVSAAYVDLTNHVKSLTINRNYDELDVTAMGNTGHTFIAGLESSTISVDLYNDDAASSVMATLNTLAGTNAAFKICQTTVAGSPSTATISATNPLYTGLVLINKITPVTGAVGEVAVQSLQFTVSGAITVASTGTW